MTWQSMPVGDLIGEWNIDKTQQGVKKKQAELFLYRLFLRQPRGKGGFRCLNGDSRRMNLFALKTRM
jgi:hypothetical protein